MVRSRDALEAEYRNATPSSLAQWERGRPVMPGGIIKGAYWNPPYPLYVDHADGCYLWDLDSRKYVDFANHNTAMILGHSHPAVVEAVQRELERGIGLGEPTSLDADMAEEITKRIPSVEKVRFTGSGTESSMHATRIVRAVTGKPKVAKFEGAYHGSHDALEVSVSPPLDGAGPADSPAAVGSWEGMARGSEEDVVVLPYNQRESVELILREHEEDLAAVFYDGKPGMLDVPDEFTRFVRDITRELGLLLVMDEVVSFRAGYSGYQGVCGIEPDLTIFGKIIGGGLPVGAIGGRADLMDVLDNSGGTGRLGQSGTFSGNNLHPGGGAGHAQGADAGYLRAPGWIAGAAARRTRSLLRGCGHTLPGAERRLDYQLLPDGPGRSGLPQLPDGRHGAPQSNHSCAAPQGLPHGAWRHVLAPLDAHGRRAHRRPARSTRPGARGARLRGRFAARSAQVKRQKPPGKPGGFS